MVSWVCDQRRAFSWTMRGTHYRKDAAKILGTYMMCVEVRETNAHT
jgi:hypothetical protein